ncbi:hypothetical protein DFJ77DRAFT_104916 [Powellomyces hirtus]|nr:hypothetical protein DFJ77DRAFT_104916 [Powellomyces hirtus]
MTDHRSSPAPTPHTLAISLIKTYLSDLNLIRTYKTFKAELAAAQAVDVDEIEFLKRRDVEFWCGAAAAQSRSKRRATPLLERVVEGLRSAQAVESGKRTRKEVNGNSPANQQESNITSQTTSSDRIGSCISILDAPDMPAMTSIASTSRRRAEVQTNFTSAPRDPRQSRSTTVSEPAPSGSDNMGSRASSTEVLDAYVAAAAGVDAGSVCVAPPPRRAGRPEISSSAKAPVTQDNKQSRNRLEATRMGTRTSVTDALDTIDASVPAAAATASGRGHENSSKPSSTSLAASPTSSPVPATSTRTKRAGSKQQQQPAEDLPRRRTTTTHQAAAASGKLFDTAAAPVKAAADKVLTSEEAPPTLTSARRASRLMAPLSAKHPSSIVTPPPATTTTPKQPPQQNHNDIQITDTFSDLDSDDNTDFTPTTSLKHPPSLPTTSPTPLPTSISTHLHSLIWGTQKPTTAWLTARLDLTRQHPDLVYGLIQKKGGPCGVLAALQARMIVCLLRDAGGREDWTQDDCAKALVKAVAECLWEVRREKGVVVAIPTTPAPTTPLTLTTHTLLTFPHLLTFLTPTLPTLPLLSLLYSLLLTHTPSLTQSEMDVPTTPLIAAHGYCTQELVNLVLVGKAVSNVFDGVKNMDETVFRGVAGPSQIGFLSLFESYGVLQVGTHYKNPTYPVWVIHSESHYTVLFATDPDFKYDTATFTKRSATFDLVYYDGLANQDCEIVVRVTTMRGVVDDDNATGKGSLVPPLERCIRTKWKGAEVRWIGCDPIL